ncbi:hypothetical protein [Ornithinimicrobium kibberense]|uniref:hypothetical protein n=1 Tax=Ornithinimicrobium kibberense TaxID=282060 RepID=UPI00361B4B5D
MITTRPSSSSAWMSSRNCPTSTSVPTTVRVIPSSSASTSRFSANHGVKSPDSDVQTSRGSATCRNRPRFLLSSCIAGLVSVTSSDSTDVTGHVQPGGVIRRAVTSTPHFSWSGALGSITGILQAAEECVSRAAAKVSL